MDRSVDEPVLSVLTAAAPRYARVAEVLRRSIGQGEFPVGALLPTEMQLAARFGVSRQTVRQAIDQLRGVGMLSTRKRAGTRVVASEPFRLARFAFQTIGDLMGLAAETEMRVHDRAWVKASGRLTAELGCRAGQRWFRLLCHRGRPGESRPLCSMEVYVDPGLASAVATQEVFRTALFMTLEHAAGAPIREIRQEIRATVMDAATARRLDAVAGTPALRITRRYIGAGGRPIEVSFATFPADRFVYSLTIQRQGGAP